MTHCVEYEPCNGRCRIERYHYDKQCPDYEPSFEYIVKVALEQVKERLQKKHVLFQCHLNMGQQNV
jgi:hypothetical protein